MPMWLDILVHSVLIAVLIGLAVWLQITSKN